MDLRLIKYFCVVAQELSFSRAAAILHIEQSPLSRAIRKLEAKYNTKLFVRSSRQLKLTWPGEILFKESIEVLARYKQLDQNVLSAVEGYQGVLKIAICDEINTFRLGMLLSYIHTHRPDLDIQIDEMHYLEAINALKNNVCGMCIAQTKSKLVGVDITPVWRKPLSVFIPLTHPLYEAKTIYLKDVMKYPIIMYDDSYYGHNLQLNNLLSSLRMLPKKIIYAKSFEVMHAMVASGRGLGLCTNDWFHNCEMSQVTVRVLSDKTRVNTYLHSIDNDLCKQVKKIIMETRIPGN